MISVEFILLSTGLAAYLVASLAGPRPALTRGAVAVGLTAHVALLFPRGAERLYFPATNMYEFFVLMTIVLMTVTLFVDLARGMPILTRLTAPVALAFLVVASLARHDAPPPPALDPRTFWSSLHVVATLASYALFMVAFVTGALYIAAQRALKHHDVAANLPPLETALKLNRGAVAVGFILLTAGIVIGYLHARSRMPGPEWRLDPKILLASATWLAYGGVLAMAAVPKLRGRREVVASMGGIVLVMLTLWATLAWSSFHKFV